MIHRHNPSPPTAAGSTGRDIEGLDLPPVILRQQAAWDRRKFLEMGEQSRKRRKQISNQKSEERRKAA